MLRIWLAMVSSLISGRPETRPGGPAGAAVFAFEEAAEELDGLIHARQLGSEKL